MGEITKFVLAWPNAGEQVIYLPTGYYCVMRKSWEAELPLTADYLDDFRLKLLKSGKKRFSIYEAGEAAGCGWKAASAALTQLEESGKAELVMSYSHRYYKLLPGNNDG
jgi:hypothetical protein